MIDYAFLQFIDSFTALAIGFAVGVVFGWIMRGLIGVDVTRIEGRKAAIAIVNTIIIILWTLSVTNAIFQFNDSQTPFFLHALMGTTLGYFNNDFGAFLLRVLGKEKNK